MIDTFAKLTTHKSKWWTFTLVVGFVVLMYIIFWMFLSDKKQSLHEQISTREVSLPRMYQAVIRLKANEDSMGEIIEPDHMTLASRVSAVTKKYGLTQIKLKSNGKSKVTLELNEVNFIKTHDSIFNLEHKWNVKVIKADFKRIKGKAGMVSGSLLLER